MSQHSALFIALWLTSTNFLDCFPGAVYGPTLDGRWRIRWMHRWHKKTLSGLTTPHDGECADSRRGWHVVTGRSSYYRKYLDQIRMTPAPHGDPDEEVDDNVTKMNQMKIL
jgi:hypothetical protein